MFSNENLNVLVYGYVKDRTLFNKEENTMSEQDEIKKMVINSLLTHIILSKKVFKRNSMVGEFLHSFFGIELSKYMLTSRTMLCGKVTKFVYSIDSSDVLNEYLDTLNNVLIKIDSGKDIFEKDIYQVIKDMDV